MKGCQPGTPDFGCRGLVDAGSVFILVLCAFFFGAIAWAAVHSRRHSASSADPAGDEPPVALTSGNARAQTDERVKGSRQASEKLRR
jgi:hypothetical protein